jgi:hypothetical protein
MELSLYSLCIDRRENSLLIVGIECLLNNCPATASYVIARTVESSPWQRCREVFAATLCSSQHAAARPGSARLGSARTGSAWHGTARLGTVKTPLWPSTLQYVLWCIDPLLGRDRERDNETTDAVRLQLARQRTSWVAITWKPQESTRNCAFCWSVPRGYKRDEV